MAQSSTIDRGAAEQIIQGLSEILADTFTLNLLTKNFHWNVVDPRFAMLHKFFDEQYEELNDAVDVIAERIRMLKGRTPASMKEYLELTTLEENNRDISADDMIAYLLKAHQKVIKRIRFLIEESQKLGDEGTADMYIQRLREHEKASWMLRSHLIDQ